MRTVASESALHPQHRDGTTILQEEVRDSSSCGPLRGDPRALGCWASGVFPALPSSGALSLRPTEALHSLQPRMWRERSLNAKLYAPSLFPQLALSA